MDFLDSFGDFIEDYTPIGVIEKSIRGVKKETKNPILKPIETVVNEVNPIKIDNNGVSFKTPEIYTDVKNIAENVEKDIKFIGDEIVQAGTYIENKIEVVAEDTFKVGSALFNIFDKVAIPMLVWMADRPMLIIGATAAYSGLLVFNQAKMAIS